MATTRRGTFMYDQEINDIEAETQQTIKSIEDQLKTLAEAVEEFASGQGSGVAAHRQTIIDTRKLQTEFITRQVESMSFDSVMKHGMNLPPSPICSGRTGLGGRVTTGSPRQSRLSLRKLIMWQKLAPDMSMIWSSSLTTTRSL